MIRLGEEYLSVLYDHLHSLLYSYHVIQADETPVLVNHDGRSTGSKSYMWVYRSGHMYPEKQIQTIYWEERKLKELSSKEILVQCQVIVKPLVVALFAYLKQQKRTT